MALLDEVANGEGILVSVSTGEALVGHIEEGVVAVLLDNVAQSAPLLLGRVDTSGVVSASVEKDNAALGHVLDVLDHTLEVETDGVLVVVAVLLDLEARVLEDSIVVGPTGVGDVDGLVARVEALEESTTDSEGTSTRDGLGDDDSALLKRCRVGTICEDGGGLGEVGYTSNASVFLVKVLLDDSLLGLLHRGKDVGLALVVTVCANTLNWSDVVSC